MLFHRLSRLGCRIAKELPKERHLSLCGKRILQRSYGHYLQSSSAAPQRQSRNFQLAFFSNNLNLYTSFSTSSEKSGEETEKINVTFVDKDGEEIHIKVPIGMNILEAAHENDIELEGACECSLACSTCHVIVMDTEYYNKLEEPTDEENDMLDLAFALTETSRLGCQVIAKPEIDGIRLAIPSATRNFAVDGFVPKPH
ncbi:Adrenodoxin-like protein 2 [Hirschfeldia incana]|nr:Adrenodoxin-like protein 2 [Hirschfeldia incana]